MKVYICNDMRCGWDGGHEDLVHPKHDPSTLLCPECHETVEDYEDHQYLPQTLPGSGEGCHECGLLRSHPIHGRAVTVTSPHE
jgi:hypothetical protein